jgi:uncharacterized membrane protein YhaH (DUF805 family)
MNNYEDYREVYELYNDMPKKNTQTKDNLQNFQDSVIEQEQNSHRKLFFMFCGWVLFFIIIIMIEIVRCDKKDKMCLDNILYVCIIITSMILIVIIVFISMCIKPLE